MNTKNFNPKEKIKLTTSDKNHLKVLEKLTIDITKDLENFKLYQAAEKLYHYFWHNFADKIIEESKTRLQTEERANAQYLLLTILETTLKLLHPFMPFITEKIYQKLPDKEKSLLMIEEWPKI